MMTDVLSNACLKTSMNITRTSVFKLGLKSFCANTRKIAHISGGNVYGI